MHSRDDVTALTSLLIDEFGIQHMVKMKHIVLVFCKYLSAPAPARIIFTLNQVTLSILSLSCSFA